MPGAKVTGANWPCARMLDRAKPAIGKRDARALHKGGLHCLCQTHTGILRLGRDQSVANPRAQGAERQREKPRAKAQHNHIHQIIVLRHQAQSAKRGDRASIRQWPCHVMDRLKAQHVFDFEHSGQRAGAGGEFVNIPRCAKLRGAKGVAFVNSPAYA